ncbi:MAG: SPOR domain-containing protein [Treponema sp.]|nr:SPOR domain-containing protein [Treponema sp.]
MDKEMKKLLLVAVSVGVFLLVTVTVALIITTPNAQRITNIASPDPVSQGRIQSAEITSNNAELPAAVNIPATQAPETNREPAAVTDRNDGTSLTIQIPAVTSAGVTQNNSAVAASTTPASTTLARTTAPATAQTTAPIAAQTTPAARQTPAPAASTPQSSTAANTTTASAAPRQTIARTINDYWIQIGAYSAMVRAEDTREVLASNGLVSIIENREVNGQNLFRVRLGPYTSEREANHWLAIVKEIDGFADSQVRQTTRQQ